MDLFTFILYYPGTFFLFQCDFIVRAPECISKCLGKSFAWVRGSEKDHRAEGGGVGIRLLEALCSFWRRGASVSLSHSFLLHCPGAAEASERNGDMRLSPEESCSGAEAQPSPYNLYGETFTSWRNYCHLFLFLTSCAELHPCLKSC